MAKFRLPLGREFAESNPVVVYSAMAVGSNEFIGGDERDK